MSRREWAKPTIRRRCKDYFEEFEGPFGVRWLRLRDGLSAVTREVLIGLPDPMPYYPRTEDAG